MPKIRIVSVPEGPDIPEEVRKGWVGVELEADGPQPMYLGSVLDQGRNYGSPIARAWLRSFVSK
jgi:hypothetical protein